jgi:hypothetical protein
MKKGIWIKAVIFSVILCIAPFVVAIGQEDQPTAEDFGGKFSLGSAIGGGGAVGLPLRYYINQMSILELGPYFRPVYNWDTGKVGTNVLIAGGYVYYVRKMYIISKQKCISDGIFIKGGYSFWRWPDYFATFGWAHEIFQLDYERHSFNTELGVGLLGSKSYNRGAPLLIYLKFSWTYFVGSTWK